MKAAIELASIGDSMSVSYPLKIEEGCETLREEFCLKGCSHYEKCAKESNKDILGC